MDVEGWADKIVLVKGALVKGTSFSCKSGLTNVLLPCSSVSEQRIIISIEGGIFPCGESLLDGDVAPHLPSTAKLQA